MQSHSRRVHQRGASEAQDWTCPGPANLAVTTREATGKAMPHRHPHIVIALILAAMRRTPEVAAASK